MPKYCCLITNIYQNGSCSLVPIRDQDKWAIMKMRNEQIYHLRQAKPLTEEIQKAYFENVVAKLFVQEQPDQILFSLLENDEFIGYGGLVHVNWIDKHAEISFVMRTELENEKFAHYWAIYLGLIERVAFEDLHLHKIFTYAFDLRPHLYDVLEKENFTKEAVLKEHCFFDGRYFDVVIHSKINFKKLFVRKVNGNDINLLFDWANDEEVRANALNNSKIKFEDHKVWFENKLKSDNSFMYIFYSDDKPIGQIRLDKSGDYFVIDYSLDKNFRGIGLGKKMLEKILELHPNNTYEALVKRENLASIKSFEKVGFEKFKESIISGSVLCHFVKKSI